jgi:hypothetical protein
MGRAERSVWEPVIEPKRSRRTTADVDIGNRTISVKLVSNDFPKIAMGSRRGGVEGGSIPKQPVLPAGWFVGEKLIDKLHEQATVL